MHTIVCHRDPIPLCRERFFSFRFVFHSTFFVAAHYRFPITRPAHTDTMRCPSCFYVKSCIIAAIYLMRWPMTPHTHTHTLTLSEYGPLLLTTYDIEKHGENTRNTRFSFRNILRITRGLSERWCNAPYSHTASHRTQQKCMKLIIIILYRRL